MSDMGPATIIHLLQTAAPFHVLEKEPAKLRAAATTFPKPENKKGSLLLGHNRYVSRLLTDPRALPSERGVTGMCVEVYSY